MNRRGIIQINQGRYRTDFSWLPDLQKIVVNKFKIKKDISIALVSPTKIKNLNRVYRSKNKVTDVLSFNIDSDLILGEVIICLAKAKEQSGNKAGGTTAELKLLTVHGILHLLGYDHETNNREAIRQDKIERTILGLLN